MASGQEKEVGFAACLLGFAARWLIHQHGWVQIQHVQAPREERRTRWAVIHEGTIAQSRHELLQGVVYHTTQAMNESQATHIKDDPWTRDTCAREFR